MEIIVFGSGAWGTALSMLLHKNGHHVTLWSRRPEKVEILKTKGKNPSLAGIRLPTGLNYTADPAAAQGAELALFVSPSYALRETAELAAPHIRPGTILVSATKGLEPGSNLRMSEILRQVIGKGCPVVVLSGPSHAEEVARYMATGCVAACEDAAMAERVQQVFMAERFRVYTNTDVAGVELCGATKNIVALGCGIIDGLALGDNAKALFMTRALWEIGGLCRKVGGDVATCYGLAGMGDLIVTCTSTHSRNYRAGLHIGKGAPAEQALQEIGAVVEGYYATGSIWELATRLDANMPVCRCIHDILYQGADPEAALRSMMIRDSKSERV